MLSGRMSSRPMLKYASEKPVTFGAVLVARSLCPPDVLADLCLYALIGRFDRIVLDRRSSVFNAPFASGWLNFFADELPDVLSDMCAFG